MQLLLDTATENPRTLRIAMTLIDTLATLMEAEPTPEDLLVPVEAAAKRPTPPPIGNPLPPSEPLPLPPGNKPVEPVQHPERHPDAPAPEPVADFAAFAARAAGLVPAGTTVDPTLPVSCAAQGASVAPIMNAGAEVAGGSSTNQPAAPPGANTVDKAGLPWDARVHSETRKLNADGTWRYRRNLDATLKAQVVAELTALRGTGQQVLLPSQPAVGMPDGMPMPVATTQVSGQSAAPDTVSAPDAPVPPVSLPGNVVSLSAPAPVRVPDAPQPGLVSISFRELMTKINRAQATGSLTGDQVTAACKAAGISSVSELASQPMLAPDVNRHIDQVLGERAA